MLSCIKENIALAFIASNGVAINIVHPKAIIIDDEIRFKQFVIGSNSIFKNKLQI